jgi:hypothetical protein
MTDWMDYLYMQQPAPASATGVEVKLSAIDPSGNPLNIGTLQAMPMANTALLGRPRRRHI